MTLVVKSLVPLVAGGGLGAGGVYVYKDVIPKTWKEHLEREGYRLIGSIEGSNSTNDYKAIFVDSEDIRKEIDSLKSLTDITTAHTQIKKYCEEELNKKTNESTATAHQMVRLCTYSGISTVKARLVRSGKSEWISSDDNWKVAFALNKYHDKFRTWINEGEGSGDINQTSKPSEKYSKLKEKCETEWKKKYSEYGDDRAPYNDIYWWCKRPEKTTVKDRLERNGDWTQETDENTILNLWQHTGHVIDQIKKDLGKQDSAETLGASSYKNWCDNQLSESLGKDDIYQNNYLMVKSVCKKSASKGK